MVVAPAAPVAAQTLRAALTVETTTAHPHGYAVTPDATPCCSVFQALTDAAPDLSIIPSLAMRWERESDTVRRFGLRPGVTFLNGASFRWEDSAACRRLVMAKGSPPFGDDPERTGLGCGGDRVIPTGDYQRR